LGGGGKGAFGAAVGGGPACVATEVDGVGVATGVLAAVSALGPEDVLVDMDGGMG
jgi:hypothetical protein